MEPSFTVQNLVHPTLVIVGTYQDFNALVEGVVATLESWWSFLGFELVGAFFLGLPLPLASYDHLALPFQKLLGADLVVRGRMYIYQHKGNYLNFV